MACGGGRGEWCGVEGVERVVGWREGRVVEEGERSWGGGRDTGCAARDQLLATSVAVSAVVAGKVAGAAWEVAAEVCCAKAMNGSARGAATSCCWF